jgi:hypothetical protein
VPFVAVDTEGNVDLDDLDAANVSLGFPRVVLAVFPCGAHTQECGVCDGLGVGRDEIMLLVCQVDVSRFE